MTAARLLVMYYPRKRARWGRYVKEKFLIRALGSLWVLIEIAVWSSAWALGISRCGETAAVRCRHRATLPCRRSGGRNGGNTCSCDGYRRSCCWRLTDRERRKRSRSRRSRCLFVKHSQPHLNEGQAKNAPAVYWSYIYIIRCMYYMFCARTCVAYYFFLSLSLSLSLAKTALLRTARMVEVARPLSLFVTVLAAAWLACQLKNVHDLNNLSRDIRLVGWALAAIICKDEGRLFAPRSPREREGSHPCRCKKQGRFRAMPSGSLPNSFSSFQADLFSRLTIEGISRERGQREKSSREYKVPLREVSPFLPGATREE